MRRWYRPPARVSGNVRQVSFATIRPAYCDPEVKLKMPIYPFSLSILISNVAPLGATGPRPRNFANPNLENSCRSHRSAPGYELVTCAKAAACSPMTTQGAMVLPVVTREDGRIRDPQPVNAVNF